MSDFKAKCTKFNFGWGLITAGFKGPTSKRREGREGKGGDGDGGGDGMGWEGGKEGRGGRNEGRG